jgi:hypothetical protein
VPRWPMFSVCRVHPPSDVRPWRKRKKGRLTVPVPRNQPKSKLKQCPRDPHVPHRRSHRIFTCTFTLKSPRPFTRVVTTPPLCPALYGTEAYRVDIGVNISTGGNTQLVIVGLPDTADRESPSRVQPVIRNNRFGAQYQRIVINLGLPTRSLFAWRRDSTTK